jgi:hypothetical protein
MNGAPTGRPEATGSTGSTGAAVAVPET